VALAISSGLEGGDPAIRDGGERGGVAGGAVGAKKKRGHGKSERRWGRHHF
jgi:hypothetical protein